MGAENYNSNSANPSPDSCTTGPAGQEFLLDQKGVVFFGGNSTIFFIFHTLNVGDV